LLEDDLRLSAEVDNILSKKYLAKAARQIPNREHQDLWFEGYTLNIHLSFSQTRCIAFSQNYPEHYDSHTSAEYIAEKIQ
jgi:hypothetical protein